MSHRAGSHGHPHPCAVHVGPYQLSLEGQWLERGFSVSIPRLSAQKALFPRAHTFTEASGTVVKWNALSRGNGLQS